MNKSDLIEALGKEAAFQKPKPCKLLSCKKLPFFKCGKELKEGVDLT